MMSINMLVLEIGRYHPPRDFKVWFLGKKAVDLLFFCSNEVNQTLLQLLGSLFLNYLQCVRTVWVAVKCRERWWRLLLKRWRTIQQRHGVGCRQSVKCLEQGGVRTENDKFSDLINWTNIFWKRVWCDGILLDDCVKCIYTVRALQLNSH